MLNATNASITNVIPLPVIPRDHRGPETVLDAKPVCHELESDTRPIRVPARRYSSQRLSLFSA